MKNYERLPRKLKKFLKSKDNEKWLLFLQQKRNVKERGEHLDKLFVKDYKNAYKVFHKMIKQGK